VIKNWLVTGDTHGQVLERLNHIGYPPDETALIILGDMGLNFYLNKTDRKNKRNVNNTGFRIYAVRGNHEERPENLFMEQMYDEEVDGGVYYEPEFPNIRYLFDGESYNIHGYSVLVIGGAYSVDKWYRLGDRPEDTDGWTGWFKDEQLTQKEMDEIGAWVEGKRYDFILTHTCPISWEPRDLFLSGLDQSKVDKSMELWLEDIKSKVDWEVWLFAHFHSDRVERPHCEMLFQDIEELDTIWNRWNGEKTFKHEWWLNKSPNFYFDDTPWAKEYKELS
jgi:3-oxoacid CoA-transferase subunit A